MGVVKEENDRKVIDSKNPHEDDPNSIIKQELKEQPG